MKLLLILILINLTLTAKDKIVKIRLSSLNTDSRYEKIDEEHYLVLTTNENKKFYMRYDVLKGKKTMMKTSSGKMINNKLVKTEEIKEYFIYDLKCIKAEDIYFNCIEN